MLAIDVLIQRNKSSIDLRTALAYAALERGLKPFQQRKSWLFVGIQIPVCFYCFIGIDKMFLTIVEATLSEKFGDSHIFDWAGESLKPLDNPKSETVLAFKVQLSQDQHISLLTGERLQDIEGHVRICSQVDSLHEDALGIGSLSYLPARLGEYPWPAMYFVEVMLPINQFASLVDTVRNGRVPKLIVIKVRGMNIDSILRSIWDITSAPELHVASIELPIPLVRGETILDEGALLVSTQLQVSNLREAFGIFVKDINAMLKWLLGMILLLLLVVTFFKH